MDNRKTSKWLAIAFTLLYAVSFPVVFLAAIACIAVSLRPGMEPIKGLAIMLEYLCIPLSMPVSIWGMWAQHYLENHLRVRWFAAMPFLTTTMAFFVASILHTLFAGR